MEFNTGELVSDSSNVQMSSVESGEMELYEELVTFIESSPEDRRQNPNSPPRKPGEDRAGESDRGSVEPAPPVEAIVTGPSAIRGAKAPGQSGELNPELPDLTRPSGPLAGLILSAEFAFSGALTRGVCLVCGAASGANDVFCVACGAFIDEAESTVQAKPTCVECGARIVADEIFCPGCGASLPVA